MEPGVPVDLAPDSLGLTMSEVFLKELPELALKVTLGDALTLEASDIAAEELLERSFANEALEVC